MPRLDSVLCRPCSLGLLLLCAASVQAQIVYVDADATGPIHDGSSWCNACLTVQDALVPATPGTTIRVADGRYTPDLGGGQTPGDRSATFQLKSGVTLEGGYAGCGAPDPNARDIALYETILSGDLNGDDMSVACVWDSPHCGSFGSFCVEGSCIIADNNGENSYHVATGSGTDATADVNGFTIAAGNANGACPACVGAGMHNDIGSPTVSNCTFSGNWASFAGAASFGGGMYNRRSNPTVTNCTFTRNLAGGTDHGGFGGGMVNSDSSNPALTNCIFSGNAARWGGGMYNLDQSNPAVSNCMFSGNRANFGGGGMFNSLSSPTVIDCTFSGNSASFGGGMYNLGTSPTIYDSTFIDNSAQHGGGMYNIDSSATVSNCTFDGNWVVYSGGGMESRHSSITVTHCTFSQNRANGWEYWPGAGGGMFNYDTSAILTNSIFWGNSAGEGGGLHNDNSSPTVTSCTFSGNVAGGPPELGYGFGGGLFNVNASAPTITNCTFSENAANFGGGMNNRGAGSAPNVTNSIFWGNVPNQSFGVAPVVNYSIMQGGWSGAGGIGVLDADPLFVDADGLDDTPGTDDDDLRLASGSPAIDAGDTTALPLDVGDLDGDGDTTERTPFDLADIPRVLDDPATPDTGIPDSGVVDMGAYEFESDCNRNGRADDCDANCLGREGACDVPGCGKSADADGNSIPDECETGACCDGTTGLCAEDVAEANCTDDQRAWSVNSLCSQLDPPCRQHTGACCDLLTGICTDDVLPGACAGDQEDWTKDMSCAQVACEAATGACCDRSPFGGCTDGLTLGECVCDECEWSKLASCDDVTCTPSQPIPTAGAWGLTVLSLLLLTGAKVRFGRVR